ncbi:MAG: HepT-like ribonuclease domain-containing protein [Terriglobia bacterium]
MLDHAREASSLVQSRTREDLDIDRQLNLAIVRLLEIIGEAAARAPEEERTRLPGSPGLQIISLRNRLIHGYDDVDPDVIWSILTLDLPPLIEMLDKHLQSGQTE